MKKLIICLLLVVPLVANGQISFQKVDKSPKLTPTKHEYNPLHVGDLWEYYTPPAMEGEKGKYSLIRIIKDTLINGRRFYKKKFYVDLSDTTWHSEWWEWNDSLGNSYALDSRDLNGNGDSLDVVTLDSLELPNGSMYVSYKIAMKWKNKTLDQVFLVDSDWVEMYGDTLMRRETQSLIKNEIIVDKFGVVTVIYELSPPTWLEGAIINGVQYGTIVSVGKNVHREIPYTIELYNNYPNPFNPTTTISYSIPSKQSVSLEVYDVSGRKVTELVRGEQMPGKHTVYFDGRNLSSGVYFYTLKTNRKTITKKMLLIK